MRRNRYLREMEERERNGRRNDYSSSYDRRRYREQDNDYRRNSSNNSYSNNDNSYEEELDTESDYHNELRQWVNRLKHRDIFGTPKEEIINKARQLGIRFNDYDEEEYIAVYYMIMSDYGRVIVDQRTLMLLAKEWLEDDDISVTPSEKLYMYYNTIIKE